MSPFRIIAAWAVHIGFSNFSIRYKTQVKAGDRVAGLALRRKPPTDAGHANGKIQPGFTPGEPVKMHVNGYTCNQRKEYSFIRIFGLNKVVRIMTKL